MKRTALLRKPPDASTLTVKLKKCKAPGCRKEYVPRSSWQKACSVECVLALSKAEQAKAAEEAAKVDRAVDRKRKQEMQPKKYWTARAKKALHAYIRARDEGKPCISCDTILRNTGRPGGDYDAGHFRSVGSAKHLEMVEENIFGQCKHCNDYKASNAQEYERRLRILRGDEYVDRLLADNEPRHLKIEDYQQIEATYKQKLKELQKERA